MNHPIYPIHHLPEKIPVGIQNETGAVEILFDVRPWLDKWPEMTFQVWVTRPAEKEAYPALSQLKDNILYWYVSEADTAIEGTGTVEIRGAMDGVDKRTGPIATEVRRTSLAATKEPPEGIKPWYDDVMELLNKSVGAVDAGEGGVFLVRQGEDYYADRTQEEIRAAVAAGKTCFLVDRDGIVYSYYEEFDNRDGWGVCPCFYAPMRYTFLKGLKHKSAHVTPKGFVQISWNDVTKTPNPRELTLKKGEETFTYDGSLPVTVEVPELPTPAETTAYLRWNGTAWVAATIDQLKADLGLA